MCVDSKCSWLNVNIAPILFVYVCMCVTDMQIPLTPITPAARISALNIVGDLLRKLGVRLTLVLITVNVTF